MSAGATGRGARPRVFKVVVGLLCAVPAAHQLVLLLSGRLPDPIGQLTDATGDWAFRLLLIALAVTPVRRVTGINAIVKVRRIVGLAAFTYATLHLLVYVGLDFLLALPLLVPDLFGTAAFVLGLTAFLLLVPPALTSTRWAVRRLGSRWRKIQQLGYAALVIALLHDLLIGKIDSVERVIYLGCTVVLLGYRMWYRLRREISDARSTRSNEAGGSLRCE